MHETHIAGNILKYLKEEEDSSQRRIKKICVRLSEFGGISSGHFLEHFREEARGSRWQGLEVEVQNIPYGPELEISRIEFV